METTTQRTTVTDAGIEKGYFDTITNEGEGYTVYEAYTHSPDGNDYLGRMRYEREARYEIVRAYAHDRKAY